MHSVPRKLTLGLILAMGVAACGDDVTVVEEVPPAAVVRSVLVTPSSATVAQGGTFQFGASVDADAGVSTTVSWSASGGTGISVDQNGLATASATATGTGSICATSTVNANAKSCAQLAIAPGAGQATVSIDQTTITCQPLTFFNPSNIGCGLLVAISTNNVYGQMDVKVNVTRPPNADVATVQLDVICVSAPCANGVAVGGVETRLTETITGAGVGATSDATDAEIAAQSSEANQITFSVQTAHYELCPTIHSSVAAAGLSATACTGIASGSARVNHPNSQKKLAVSLLRANGTTITSTATAQTGLSFRNANGFHVTVNTNLNSPATNSNSTCGPLGTAPCPIRVNALAGLRAGLAYNGGTPLDITAIPVVYATGALHPNGFTGVLAASAGTGVGFGSAACDLNPFGGGARLLGSQGGVGGTAVLTNSGTNLRGVLGYSNVTPTAASPAPPGTVTGYEMGGCAAGLVGEIPSGVGVDAAGNPLINFSLGAASPYGALNTLNAPLSPVNGNVGTTVPLIRLDNGGPPPIFGYATGRNDIGAAGPDACFGVWLNGNPLLAPTNAQGAGCGAIPLSLRVQGVLAGQTVNQSPQAAFVGSPAVPTGRIARMNGWTNNGVAFNKLSSTMAIAAGWLTIPTGACTLATAVACSEGLVAPSANTTGLPLDLGVGNNIVGGNPSTLLGRAGACTTVAACAALPVRALTDGLAQTSTGNAIGAIVQSVDPFGNLTNPPAPGGTVPAAANFGGFGVNAACNCVPNPLAPGSPYVLAGVLNIGMDTQEPVVTARGTGGVNTVGTTFTDHTIQGVATANFHYTADDIVPAPLLGSSGILSVAPGSDLYVQLARRDGATLQFFCNSNANYQPVTSVCADPAALGWGSQSTNTVYVRPAGEIASDPALSAVRAYYQTVVFTRDQAGNQTLPTGANGVVLQTRDFIFDNTPPSSFGATFTPGVIPAGGTLTFSGSATEDLDVGRAAFSIRFPSLTANGVGADFIRLPWANRSTTLPNPIAYTVPTALIPSTSAVLSQVWNSPIRSIEVVNAADNDVAPFFCAPGAGNGNHVCNVAGPSGAYTIGTVSPTPIVQFPGGLGGGAGADMSFFQDGNIAGGAGPTQFNYFAQSVSRVGLLANAAGPPASIPGGVATALNYGQSGMGGTPHPCNANSLPVGVAGGFAYWTSVQNCGQFLPGGIILNQFWNMQWALLNPQNVTAVDLNAAGTAKIYTAIAFGANGPMQAPFQGGVRFYAVDIRQPLNIDGNFAVPPVGTGTALVEICGPNTTNTVSLLNDQATNTWQYSCTYLPSGGTAGGTATSVLHTNDLAGFNFANSVNLQVNYVAGVPTPNGAAVPNQGFWGLAQLSGPNPSFQQGWQGLNTTPGLAASVMPVIAVGCNTLGNCLATRVSGNAGFNVTP